VSYKSVFASDGCSAIGSTIYNTIVPIPGTEQLSSAFGGTLPCVAHVQNAFTQEFTATASFNVNDLIEPVPFSIYSSQPWCATYQFEHGCNKECPTTEAYKPIIVVPEVVLQNMDPAWASCYGDIRGVYDPPIALTQVASVKGSQITASVPTTSEVIGATPASSPSHPAAETSGAIVDPGGLSFNSVAASAPHSSTRSDQDYGGVDIATALPDDLHSSNVDDGVAPHASELSDSGPTIGGAVAEILGGANYLNEEDTPPSNGVSPTGAAYMAPDFFITSSAADNSEPQALHSSSLGQGIGGTIATILGAARPSTGLGASESHQDITASDSLPTLTSNPESWLHKASGLIQEGGHASQVTPEETSESSPTLGNSYDSDTSVTPPSEVSASTFNKGSNAVKPTSTSASASSSEAGAEISNAIDVSVSMGTTVFPGGRWVPCKFLTKLIVVGVLLLQTL
jgi:hypothetical protein